MKFSLKFSVKIERSDALERALEQIQVSSDHLSETGQEPEEIEDENIIGFGFRS